MALTQDIEHIKSFFPPLIWISLTVAWAVSVFTVIEEFCMVKACRDTAAFTVFGLNMGIFGVGYFSLLLALRWYSRRLAWCERLVWAAVFAGVGAELRLLWIQKYVIGAWCPLCVTICFALVSAALVMTIEKFLQRAVMFRVWLPQAAIAACAGFLIALIGVRALY